MTAASPRPLAVCQQLFAALNEEGLCYCHWKSNEHLLAGLAGETDLDLLVAEEDRERFARILARFDFKPVCSPPEKRYPGLEDFLGFDTETGGLVHLHVHHALVLGRQLVKNHRLPIESALLTDVRTLHGVRVPSAELEMLLLVIRANMKLPLLQLLRYWHHPGVELLPKAIVREFRFLADDWDESRFSSVVQGSGLPLSDAMLRAFVSGILTQSITTRDLQRTRALIFRSLRRFRRGHPLLAGMRGVRGEFLRWRPIRQLAPRKKTLPDGGPVIALVGADGSGKTTLSGDLCAWLSWKLLARPVYFGIPKQAVRYRVLRWLAARLRSPRLSAPGRPLAAHVVRLEQRLRAAQWLFVARRRLAAYQRARRLAERGAVVVADRFPVPEFRAMPEPMDGPRIRGELGAAQQRCAAREEALYDRIGRPSRAFVLRTSLETLRARKPGLDPVIHGNKASAVNAIQPDAIFSIVDGERRYEEVLLDLKRQIWSLL